MMDRQSMFVPLPPEELTNSEVVIRDDTKRNMEETFQALVKTGPIESWVEFTVLDIPVTFALLLGRPWFHALGGVPVHQKRKFPHSVGVVTISAESGAAIAAVQVAQKEVQAPTGFQVAGI
uniref:Uncharacterized protein n=1 Tax=Utricularia reniformis TaxID=192314 RepID=A0A1Y0B433_9LAMI|nr:hypothetical protein AEK19_MT2059 [Utricularia reniformis]ART32216.1 hypothetical protein AEK19_MT2059 [Utricularia reniformis]